MADMSQYVTLGIDRDIFAVPVEQVREILDLRPIARLPQAPSYLLGMIDVRGHGVPVVDLRCKLGLPPTEPTDASRILVLELPAGQRTLTVGLLADRVFEVTGLDGGETTPPPEIGTRWDSSVIQSIGRRHDAFVIVVALGHLFSSTEIPLLSGDSHVAAA